jgi:uncharacterized protein (TIGR03437 family)
MKLSFRLLTLIASLLWSTLLADHITYTYDAAERLARVDYANGASIAYTYDKAGNLLSRLVTGPGARPSITAAGVVNAASFKGGSVAPGEMVTIFGTGIGPAALAGFLIANNLVSGNVAATRFLFDGVPAPIIYVSANQSTVMVPFAVAGKASTQLVAEYQGVQSPPVTIPVVAAVPGLFTIAQNGSGSAAIVNQDGSINSASAPAPKGSVVLLFLTGDGQTNPAGIDGKLALDSLPMTAAPVTVTFGTAAGNVAYSGVAPQSIAGFTQINVIIPDNAPSGSAVPLVVSVGGIASPTGVTIAIQ